MNETVQSALKAPEGKGPILSLAFDTDMITESVYVFLMHSMGVSTANPSGTGWGNPL